MNPLCLALLLALALAEVLPLHRHVAQEIFQENKPYLIYVHGAAHNLEAEAVFNGYCFGDKLCAILNPHIEDYHLMLQFIAIDQDEYFLILDAAHKRKYLLPVTRALTQHDLLAFEYRFLNGELEPYFASEPLPSPSSARAQPLVGHNLGEFLRRQERLKVVLLYAPALYCPSCPAVLEQFRALAEGEGAEVAFGYFNTFLNDHPVIHDEKNPNVLVFVDQNYESPFELSPHDPAHLARFIQQTLRPRGREEM